MSPWQYQHRHCWPGHIRSIAWKYMECCDLDIMGGIDDIDAKQEASYYISDLCH